MHDQKLLVADGFAVLGWLGMKWACVGRILGSYTATATNSELETAAPMLQCIAYNHFDLGLAFMTSH